MAVFILLQQVIKLFEIHDAGACVVRLAETAISIADKDDPNLVSPLEEYSQYFYEFLTF